tara:strand:- start:131 stop:934 length:804 start_codon:yes stop_codon:yes gene_type:complete
MGIIDPRALQAAVKTWLQENIPNDKELPGPNDDLTPEMEEWIRSVRRDLGARGWLAPRWPTYFGGGGFPPQAAAVIEQEMRQHRLPPFGINMTFLVPLRVWGTEEQKQKWMTPTLRGEITVCQIQSEPLTGSDLAYQATTAIKDGDEYVVNGEKGYIASQLTPDYLFTLVTTDPDGPKYENLSMVILRSKGSGIDINSRMMITGKSQRSFVINDVRLPIDDVIGGEGNGWEVAQTLLDVERGGKGVTLEQAKQIEITEREHWRKPKL